MAFSIWQKIITTITAVVILLCVHIVVGKKCSSQTVAVLFRIEIIAVIQSVMFMLSRKVWQTAVFLLSTSSCHSQTTSTVGLNESDFNRRPIRKWKNSEADLSTTVTEYQEARVTTTTVTVWKVLLFVYLGMCHTSYLTNLFLLNTNPHWFSMLAYACFGSYIQLLTGWIILKTSSLAVHLFAKLRNSTHPPTFLSKKNIAVFAFVYSIAASTYGLYTASQPPTIKFVTVPIKDLPPNLEGLSIVQLSDIHLGPTVGLSKLKKIVEMVNEENPDIMVLTGDLVDGSVEKLKLAAQPLEAVRSTYGNFFVSGNHEYYTGDVDNWFTYLKSLGFHVLHNSNVKVPLTVAENEGDICIAGTDDIQADRIGYIGHKFDLDKAVSSCNVEKPVILLAHQPYAARLALDSHHRIDLVLSGHTHGGQMFPLIIGAYFLNPFFAGLYQYGGKGGFVYVSQGTQYWGIPMRIATSMEITRITLQKAI